MDEYIKGAFAGALIICLFMLNAHKPDQCMISVTRGQVTTITIGTYDE